MDDEYFENEAPLYIAVELLPTTTAPGELAEPMVSAADATPAVATSVIAVINFRKAGDVIFMRIDFFSVKIVLPTPKKSNPKDVFFTQKAVYAKNLLHYSSTSLYHSPIFIRSSPQKKTKHTNSHVEFMHQKKLAKSVKAAWRVEKGMGK